MLQHLFQKLFRRNRSHVKVAHKLFLLYILVPFGQISWVPVIYDYFKGQYLRLLSYIETSFVV